MTDWPKKPYQWVENNVLYISIPFTWNLPSVYAQLTQASWIWDDVVVGGPAVELMPDYFMALPWVEVRHDMPGILQRINPQATRTTTGCPNRCGFCGIGCGKIEAGGFKELDDWPDLPIICDNNLLAASIKHFDRVIDRLKVHGWADFNQGLDCRLLNEHHAQRLSQINKPIVRLALDSIKQQEQWETAFNKLRNAGIQKKKIRSYALVGFKDTPDEAWERCRWIESHHINVLPMWYHSLDQLQVNTVTQNQTELGWNEHERTRIMGWFYKRRNT